MLVECDDDAWLFHLGMTPCCLLNLISFVNWLVGVPHFGPFGSITDHGFVVVAVVVVVVVAVLVLVLVVCLFVCLLTCIIQWLFFHGDLATNSMSHQNRGVS